MDSSNRFSENESIIEQRLTQIPLVELEEFCEYWMPRFFPKLSSFDPAYNSARVFLLQKLTGKGKTTIYSWLRSPKNLPDDVKLLLSSLNLAWRILDLYNWESDLFSEK